MEETGSPGQELRERECNLGLDGNMEAGFMDSPSLDGLALSDFLRLSPALLNMQLPQCSHRVPTPAIENSGGELGALLMDDSACFDDLFLVDRSLQDCQVCPSLEMDDFEGRPTNPSQGHIDIPMPSSGLTPDEVRSFISSMALMSQLQSPNRVEGQYAGSPKAEAGFQRCDKSIAVDSPTARVNSIRELEPVAAEDSVGRWQQLPKGRRDSVHAEGVTPLAPAHPQF